MLKHLVAETCPDWFVELLNWTSQERPLSAESTLDTYFHNGRLTDLTGVTYFHGCENLFGKIGFAHPLLDEVTQYPGAVLSSSDHPKGRQLLPSTGLTLVFLRHFGLGLWLTFPLILSLSMLIILLGQAVGRREGWSPFESFYWAFITATTVGYGDIRPVTRASRICAILIAFLGLTLTGIVIAVAVQAATLALNTSRSVT